MQRWIFSQQFDFCAVSLKNEVRLSDPENDGWLRYAASAMEAERTDMPNLSGAAERLRDMKSYPAGTILSRD